MLYLQKVLESRKIIENPYYRNCISTKLSNITTQQTFTSSSLTIETFEKGAKYVQS